MQVDKAFDVYERYVENSEKVSVENIKCNFGDTS